MTLAAPRTDIPRIGIIVAARMGSSRLPGKALKPLAGVPSLTYLLRRLRPSQRAVGLVLATTTQVEDDILATLATDEGVAVFRGSPTDLVARYTAAAAAHHFDQVVRVTADCPFVDAASLDFCLSQASALAPFDLASTKTVFPPGIDYELYNTACMATLHHTAPLTANDREHLTLYLYNNPRDFTVCRFTCPETWCRPPMALTLDTATDYAVLSRIAESAGEINAPVEDILSIAKQIAPASV